MTNLKKEYTDIKNIEHSVEHHTAFNEDDNNRERIIEELCNVLTKPSRCITA